MFKLFTYMKNTWYNEQCTVTTLVVIKSHESKEELQEMNVVVFMECLYVFQLTCFILGYRQRHIKPTSKTSDGQLLHSISVLYDIKS